VLFPWQLFDISIDSLLFPSKIRPAFPPVLPVSFSQKPPPVPSSDHSDGAIRRRKGYEKDKSQQSINSSCIYASQQEEFAAFRATCRIHIN